MTCEAALKAICKFDTPSVTNVVATYPKNPLCLGLYNPWQANWYTDDSLRCIYPELGALAGHAVTCVFGLADPSYERLTPMDVMDAVDASPKPTILVIEQQYPPDIQGKVGLAGGVMATILKRLGCLGLISNGPSRDVDEIRPMGFQYLLSGITPGHGEMAVRAVNVPVSVAGMNVSPGEIIHMDENGACKFPPDKLEAVLANVESFLDQEGDLIKRLKQVNSAAEVRLIMEGHSYAARED